MGHSPPPTKASKPYEWALWLHEQLQDPRTSAGRWEGVLPKNYNFEEIIGDSPDGVITSTDPALRRIEFSPTRAGVFETLEEFLEGPARKGLPAEFAIRNPRYIHGKSDTTPKKIAQYLDAVKFWGMLKGYSDAQNLGALLFIKSHDAKVWISPDLSTDDLVELVGLTDFERQYFNDDHHRDQKRSLVRNSLVELFKPLERVKFGTVLSRFVDLTERVRSSYALFVQDFSYEKLLSETEKLNLDDTLRLNKVFADIQNQLLALPAALIAAGAGFKYSSLTVNLPILFGVIVFAWVMWHLIGNQKNSVLAIIHEVEIRKQRVKDLPDELSSKLLPLFLELTKRSNHQILILQRIKYVVGLVLTLVVGLFIHMQWPSILTTIKNSFVELWKLLLLVWCL